MPDFTLMKTPEYHWECITKNAAFAPRDGAGALVFQDKMWLLGGWNPNDKKYFPHICNSEIWSSIDGTTWTLKTHAPWEGRHTAGYVVHQNKMWVIGGDVNQGHYQNDVWNSADGILWKQVTDNVQWGPRALHHTLAFAGKIWVLGGQTIPSIAPEDEKFYNDVWCSSDGTNWECVLTSAPWSPRGMIGGSVVFQNRLWLLGGGTYDTPTQPQRKYFNEVWSTANGIDWKQHTNAPWAARQYHDVAVFDNRMWVLEGCDSDSGNRNDVWHSANGEFWEQLPKTPWPPRHAASVFVFNDALWMVAGNNMTSDVWRLNRTDTNNKYDY